jgi:hypothetical protein
VDGSQKDQKPMLVQLLERAAAVMGLDTGQVLLELRFEDGNLVMWWTHRQRRKPADLRPSASDGYESVAYTRSRTFLQTIP